MSMKQVLAAFMGVTLLVGNGPVSVFAEEAAVEAAAEPAIVNLETQGRTNPIGVDETNPAFSWQMQSGEIGAAQKSYQIVVQDKEGSVVWDSGVVESSQSNEIKYEGSSLTPATQYSWKVTVTDNKDNSIQSETATFETGLMDTSSASWGGAKWIGAGELSLDAASIFPQMFRWQRAVTGHPLFLAQMISVWRTKCSTAKCRRAKTMSA